MPIGLETSWGHWGHPHSEPSTRCVPEMVDQVIHKFLVAMEESADVEIVIGSAGVSEVRASEESDGLAGEPHGDRGWIARFSKVG